MGISSCVMNRAKRSISADVYSMYVERRPLAVYHGVWAEPHILAASSQTFHMVQLSIDLQHIEHNIDRTKYALCALFRDMKQHRIYLTDWLNEVSQRGASL